jgi:hypothetical protein
MNAADNRQEMLRRLAALETAQAARSVDLGGDAGGGAHRVRITGVHPSSPGAGSVRVFRGDVYDGAAGFGGAATASGVTIILGQLAVDAIVPSGTQSAVAALYGGRQWTNNVGGTVTEDVYEFDIPRWL